MLSNSFDSSVVSSVNSNNCAHKGLHCSPNNSIIMKKENKHFICNSCSYATTNKQNYEIHLETIKHLDNVNNNNYFCLICDYNTSKKANYDKHNETEKHKDMIKNINLENNKCNDCNKCFCSNASLQRHKKVVHKEDTQENPSQNSSMEKELIMHLINDNKDFKNLLIEQLKKEQEEKKELTNFFVDNSSKMIELAKLANNTNHSHNTNNSHNKNKFNLNLFLNEQCKNAINLSDFIESVQVDLEDVTNIGKIGFVSGITDIILRHLKKLDIHTRPIHCTDLKREVLHIREENKLNKETDKKSIKKCVDKIAHKNCQKIVTWQDTFQESRILDSPEYKLWLEIIGQSMNTGDRGERNTEKVIDNIAKEVLIDKNDSVE